MKKQLKITFLGVRDKDGVMHDPDHLPQEIVDAVADLFIKAKKMEQRASEGKEKKDL